MKLREPVTFLPRAGGNDVLAWYWLRQVTLRLRREVCWLWRERQAQGVSPALPQSGSYEVPPFVEYQRSPWFVATYHRFVSDRAMAKTEA